MNLRFSFPPYPLVGRPRDVLRKYVDGRDPVSGRPLMPQVVDALTKPLTEDERNPKAVRGTPRSRLLSADTEENLHKLFLENGWTDGAPIVLPTEARVAHMLTGTAADPNEVVGQMTITIHQERLEYTVEKVAVNAVMAGAGPEHLPVILALAASEEGSMPSSTTSFGRMAVVNGPIREEIGMNSGLGALSPFNHANTVIGRAWTLMTINLGDARLGETFMGSTGHNLNYNNMMIAENEERSIWAPFHVQRGKQSCRQPVQGGDITAWPAGCCRRHRKNAYFMQAPELRLPRDGSCCQASGIGLMIPGLPYLSENFKMTVGQFWGSDVVYSLVEPNARNGVEPYASWLKLPKDALVAPYNSPEKINVVVVGGETQALWLTTDMWHTKTVSIDKWRPKTGVYKEDEHSARRRYARQKRHAAALNASGYDQ
jgi:hypothetical protein